jgi:uncharacterized protein YyaL (SSP411 family)
MQLCKEIKSTRLMNRLKNAVSPYLLQHASNPVDWYPWGEEAFERAKKENKPVLVSIGYAACHWCHVMERESFEDKETAAFMNARFICIKVDREEHPGVDHFYMDALQSLHGSGGWPLNMFVTPDKKPFYGGTYFPPRKMYNRSSWMETLQAVEQAWKHKPEDIATQAEQMVRYLKQASDVAVNTGTVSGFADNDTNKIVENLLENADREWGGFGAAPKFPATFAIQFLLEYDHYQKGKKEQEILGKEALAQALLSIDKMIAGGIYDQIGGGFSRYSTDKYWLAPHFEKMLYDNALLISLLADAYRITGNEVYKAVIKETIAFCNRELRDELTGGYYCALNADSEGIEGKFYTWTIAQWKEALPDAHPALVRYFGIEETGNWEGTNILWRAEDETQLINEFNLTKEEWSKQLSEAKERLFQKRSKRIRPSTDDKLLLSWNALMNIALSKAAVALQEKPYLDQAAAHLDWMLNAFKNTEGWKHAFKNGTAYIDGNLDDYAYLINALLQYASSSGEPEYVKQAVSLTEETIPQFLHEENGFFYFTGKARTDIPVRKIEVYDGATPAANAVMAGNLVVLAGLAERLDWMEQAEKMLQGMQATTVRYARSFSYWACLAQRKQQGFKQLIISGATASSLLTQWQSFYYPEVVSLCQTSDRITLPVMEKKFSENKNLLYLCQQFECKTPVETIGDLIEELKKTG